MAGEQAILISHDCYYFLVIIIAPEILFKILFVALFRKQNALQKNQNNGFSRLTTFRGLSVARLCDIEFDRGFP